MPRKQDHLLSGVELENRRVHMVLENFHCIRSTAVHEMLSYLIQYLPDGLQLTVSTRVDPPICLERLRLQNRLLEIRQEDLCFSRKEIESFLNGVMELGLSAENLDGIIERTEGWIAGIQTAALALARHENAEEFIRGFSGSHAYIMNYLVREVLSRQPIDIRTFLLESSILRHPSGNTVKTRTSTIYSKLGVHNRTQAVAAATKLGILQL